MNKYFAIALIFTAVLAGCAATPKRTSTTYYGNNNPQPVYNRPQQPSAQSEQNKKLLKNAVLGAATGAIAAEASGGKAGKGALIGAGTNVIGGALFDMLTAPKPQQQQVIQQNPQYAPYVDQWQQQNQGNKKVIRKYDSDGKIVSEEEVWQ